MLAFDDICQDRTFHLYKIFKIRDLAHFLVKYCLPCLLKITKLMLIIGQVRLSKGKLCPAGLGKGLGYGPTGLEPLAVARNSRKASVKIR